MCMLWKGGKAYGILGQGILKGVMKINLPYNVKKIISVLEENGFEAYAVGGCVRDSLIGKKPDDWDIACSAKPEQVKALFHKTIDTGIRHGTVTVMMKHVGYEVTTYRIDGEYTDSRHPKKVIFTPSLTEDLKRRDFTINAMAYSDRTGIVDIFDGAGDLQKKVIRCVGNPKERFGEDALRILRAVRFSAQLGFSIEEGTAQAAEELASNLKKISRERIRTELDKLIMSGHPDHVRLLENLGILPCIFSGYVCCGETASLADRLVNSETEHYIRWALFITGISFENLLESLKFDNKSIKICNTMKKYANEELRADKAYIRHMAVKIGRDIFRRYYLPFRKVLGNTSEELLKQIEKAYDEIIENEDCLSLREMNINGNDLKEAGIAEGERVGEVLNALFCRVLEDTSINDRDTLLELAKIL